jgi:WD40 repeat protein
MTTIHLPFHGRHSLVKRLFICVVTLFTLGTLNAQVPTLALDTGGHTATIRSVLFTSDGKYLVSAGDDKEIRVWDVQSGAAVRSIRGQIGPGDDGKIDAIALSRNDRYLAVGGWLQEDDRKRGHVIRIVDFKTGEIVRILPGHENVVEGLAFSPDGGLLASASADGTVRIWDVSTGRETKKLRADSNRVHAVAFSPDGTRIASASVGGGLRLWGTDGRQRADLRGHRSDVLAVAFDPHDEYLASISEDRTVRLWNAKSGAFIKEIAIGGDSVSNITFTTGRGTEGLLLSYFSRDLRRGVCEVISIPEGRSLVQFIQHEETIMASTLAPDSELAASAGTDHEIYLWDPRSGREVRKLIGRGKPITSVGFAHDGRSIGFGTDRYAERQPNAYGPLQRTIWLKRDAAYHIGLGPDVREADFQLAETKKADYSLRPVEGGKYGGAAVLEILRSDKVTSRIKRDDVSGYEHRSFTFTPDGQYVISGGIGGVLKMYTAQTGADRGDFVGHTGQVVSVAVSPDSRVLVSGSDDETIRLWEISTRKPLLTLFIGSDDEWVAWTPEGFYTSSVGGDSYIGWHVNQGRNKSARYFSAVQFQKTLYRPDIVDQRLGGAATPVASIATELPKMLPPTIQVNVPANTAEAAAPVSIEITSDTLPITAVRVFLNGAQILAEVDELQGRNVRHHTENLSVPLRAGTNSLQIVASNGSAFSRGEEWTIRRETTAGADKPEQTARGDLYVLAVGLSEYENPAIPRPRFAQRDAADFAATLKKQEGLYFREVYTRVLSNSEATKSRIEEELTTLKQSGGQNDTRVLYLSGHGAMTEEGYHFWGFQHDTNGNLRGDVSWALITNRLSAAPGKNVLVVDTCRAGGVAGGVDFNQVLKRTGEAALLVFAASTATEESFEFNQLGHGVFTDAWLKTLSVAPAQKEFREIYSDELGVRVRKHVQEWLKQYCATTNDPSDPAVKRGCQQTPVHFALPVGLKAYPLFASSSP